MIAGRFLVVLSIMQRIDSCSALCLCLQVTSTHPRLPLLTYRLLTILSATRSAMLQRGTSLIRQPECSRCFSAAPPSGDTPTQARGERLPQGGRGRRAAATGAGATVGNCCRCWAWAIVAATINNNAMWQPTARISCKNLFMTLCCNCVGHTLHTILTSHFPLPLSPYHTILPLPTRVSLCFWAPACCCCCCSSIAHLPLIYGTLIGQTIIGHISSHFLLPPRGNLLKTWQESH